MPHSPLTPQPTMLLPPMSHHTLFGLSSSKPGHKAGNPFDKLRANGGKTGAAPHGATTYEPPHTVRAEPVEAKATPLPTWLGKWLAYSKSTFRSFQPLAHDL